MSSLGHIVGAIEAFNSSVEAQVRKARSDPERGAELRRHWEKIREGLPIVETPTGLKLPRLALPPTDEPGEIARYLYGEGLPGEFPFLNGAYREMYLEPIRELESFEKDGEAVAASVSPAKSSKQRPQAEEPTRLFSGLMLAEDTNERFHS